MKILSPAKLNLCLDILEKDRSGYHQIQTVFYEEKSLCDIVKINNSKESDSLSIARGTTKTENSLALTALQLLKKNYKIKKFAHIEIEKNIPFSSGLGGASSNAAAVLKGLNKMWKLDLTEKELLKLAAKLGMDVPFFILGGVALGTNYGEVIERLSPIKNLKFKIVAKSSLDIKKTQNAYAKLNLENCGKNTNKTLQMLTAIKNKDNKKILENLHNDFETIFPIPKNHHLCGSGPSVYTLAPK